jgi:HAD superfamily hydrolase (TIGR01509 family)
MAGNLRQFAVLWDMDGVLVDTGELHLYTWQVVLEELGYAFSREEFITTFGQNSYRTLEMLFGEKPAPEFANRIIDRKESLFREMVTGKLELLPGVRYWLEQFHEWGLKQAVASSAPIENINILVDELEIRVYFDAIVPGVNLPAKPEPDIYLKAAQSVGVPPKRCIVIEDAVHGVEGALAAGMRCIAVTTTNTTTALRGAELVLDDLAELDQKVLQSLLE